MRKKEFLYYKKRMKPYLERFELIEEFVNKELDKKYKVTVTIPVCYYDSDKVFFFYGRMIQCEGIRMKELYARREEIMTYDTLYAMLEEKIHEGIRNKLNTLTNKYKRNKKILEDLLK